jgi:hypothetical protein
MALSAEVRGSSKCVGEMSQRNTVMKDFFARRPKIQHQLLIRNEKVADSPFQEEIYVIVWQLLLL